MKKRGDCAEAVWWRGQRVKGAGVMWRAGAVSEGLQRHHRGKFGAGGPGWAGLGRGPSALLTRVGPRRCSPAGHPRNEQLCGQGRAKAPKRRGRRHAKVQGGYFWMHCTYLLHRDGCVCRGCGEGEGGGQDTRRASDPVAVTKEGGRRADHAGCRSSEGKRRRACLPTETDGGDGL